MKDKSGAPAIDAQGGNLMVSSCDFVDGKNQIHLGPGVESAVIMGNRLRGGAKITNESGGDVQIGLNVTR